MLVMVDYPGWCSLGEECLLVTDVSTASMAVIFSVEKEEEDGHR